ncbi:LegC family aminotransferase [Rhodopseudomonas palustris]
MVKATDILTAIREVYGTAAGPIPLHAPVFEGNEKAYVQNTIDSTFVSYVGEYVTQFEADLQKLTGTKHAIAMVNGTTALHMALILAGVEPGDLVITQSLSFAGTTNAISHAGAVPAFVDVNGATLGMSPTALLDFLTSGCESGGGVCRHSGSGRRVGACVPMHTFGHPCQIDDIVQICNEWSIPVVEDAAEAVGSTFQGRHCGTFGNLGIFSFNGNKIVTCGGGGAILTNDEETAARGKHLTTTAKVKHRWRFFHDEVGYNLRLPNLNAALGCAQLEQIKKFIDFKRDLAARYRSRFDALGVTSVAEPSNSQSIYWLCAILLDNLSLRDEVLALTNDADVMTRPIWEPLHTLPMYQQAPCGPLSVTMDIASRLVNIPSGYKGRVNA